MGEKNINNRYKVSVIFNFLNSGLNFASSIVIARTLLPEEYGNFQFLLAIFMSIFAVLNMGTQNGYFTFISQKTRSYKFFLHYFIWEIIQLFAILLFIFGISQSLSSEIFLNDDKILIYLAAVSVFFTKNIKELIFNTFESKRFTLYYLGFVFAINVGYLIVVYMLSHYEILSVYYIFAILIVEYFVFLVISIVIVIKNKNYFVNSFKRSSLQLTIYRYFLYAKPLFFSIIVGVIYAFSEKWLLQKFGGSLQQAYLAIASQLTMVILLFTTSLLKIFWKEVSFMVKKKEFDSLEFYFFSLLRKILFVSCFVSLFLVVNADIVVVSFYSEKYHAAVNIFIFMSLYTIHQSLGQIFGTFLMASEDTKYYSKVSIYTMLVQFICIVFVLLPEKYYGLNAGAIGIAIVMFIINIAATNIYGYYIIKKYKWKSIILLQVKYIFIVALFLFSVYYIVSLLSTTALESILYQICIILISFAISLLFNNKYNIKNFLLKDYVD